MRFTRILQLNLLNNNMQYGRIVKRFQHQSYQAAIKDIDGDPEAINPSDVSNKNVNSQAMTGFMRERKVQKIFMDMANSYEQILDAVSLILLRLWRDILVQYEKNGNDINGAKADISLIDLKYLKKLQNFNDFKPDVAVLNNQGITLKMDKENPCNLVSSEQIRCNISIQWKCGNTENLSITDKNLNDFTKSLWLQVVKNISKCYEKPNLIYNLVTIFCVWNLIIWKIAHRNA
ncbi:2-methoxy-6-polyprenyl-1,4-benzoquinol methylase, mitochondrial-like [Haematobia irritans]|uniref:2-methoxy-6-polyprenyl-1,4-benzoquinol methylase, mitochondrial-like n=1 Tax=Haematobia irritans TaxID=7368 RepID=UPI003F4FA2CF